MAKVRDDDAMMSAIKDEFGDVVGELGGSPTLSKTRRLTFKVGSQVAARMLPDGMKALAPSGATVVPERPSGLGETGPDPARRAAGATASESGVRLTPQGSPVSPVLANLFLHYAFDAWMAREFPTVRFERYVDDAVVHCVSERQARQVLAALQDRMVEVGLRLHPGKTRIVYCKDGRRQGAYEHTSFTFLGYTFRPRGARAKDGRLFLSFAPAISRDALTKIGREVRSWRLHRRIGQSFSELARWINPIVRGWMQYYGALTRSTLYPLLTRINAYLMPTHSRASATSDRTTTSAASTSNAGCATTSPSSPPSATESPSNPPPKPTPHRHNMTRLRKVHRVLSTAHPPGVFSTQTPPSAARRSVAG